MTENTVQNPSNSGSNDDGQTRRSPLVILLGSLVSLEAALVLAGALYFLSRIFLEIPENFAGALVIFTITLLIAMGLIATAVGTFRAQPWTRGAIITWQIMQFGVATSFIQGIEIWRPIGYALVGLSLVATSVLFLPKTTKAISDTSIS